MSSLLTLQGIAGRVTAPARGDFARLVNLATAIVFVVIPGVVASMTSVGLFCLILVRPREEKTACPPTEI
jgi:hypothetical protein